MKKKVERLGFAKGAFSLLERQARGVGILVRNGIEINNVVKDANGRIIGATLSKEDAPNIVVVSVYAPNLGASKELQAEYVAFMVELDRIITECLRLGKTKHLVVAGDFNILTDLSLDSWSGNGKTFEVPLEALSEVTTRYGLADVFRIFNPEKKTTRAPPPPQR